MGAACSVPTEPSEGSKATKGKFVPVPASLLADATGVQVFTSLQEDPGVAGGFRPGSGGISDRLRGYAVSADGGTGGDSKVVGGPRPSFKTLAQVAVALQQDRLRRPGLVVAEGVNAGGASASSMALPSRPFVAIPQLPGEVVSALAALSLDRFAVGNVKGQIMVFSWMAATLEASWDASSKSVTTLEPHDDCTHLFCGAASGEITMWDLSGNKKRTLAGHSQEVRSIVRIGSGLNLWLATGSRDCTVRIWSVEKEDCLHSVHIMRNVVTRMRAFPPEQVAIHGFVFTQASEDLRLRFWAVEADGKLAVRRLLHASTQQLSSLDVSPCGLFVAAGAKGFERDICELSVWDMRTMEKTCSVNAFDNTIEALRIVSRALGTMQILAVSCDATLKCFTFPELEPIWEESTASSSPYTSLDVCMDASGQAAVFAATTEPEVFVWSWPASAAEACPQGALRGGSRRAVSLDHPPMMRARACQRAKSGSFQGNSGSNAGAASLDNLQQPDSEDLSQTLRPSQRPKRLESLGRILSQAEQDASTLEARQKLAARMPSKGPIRVPHRDRIKGVSPLVRASKKAADEDVRRIFADIDRDSNGWIDAEELREYLGDYLGFGETEISRFLHRASADAAPTPNDDNASCGESPGLPRLTFEAFRKNYALLNAVFVSNRHGESFLRRPGAVGRQQFCMEDCTNCQVLVCDMTDQVFVDQCSGCRVLLGPSSSSTFVRDCTDCVFWIATQQLRTRDLKRCTFYLYSRTEPVIEESSELTFAPWNAAYPRCSEHFRESNYNEKRNMWNAIFDFTPARGRANWSIIPFHKCECMTVAFEELSEDRQHVLPPDNPCALLSHDLLCAEPLDSGEHKGHCMGDMPQVRPKMPERPPDGSMPTITVERDGADGGFDATISPATADASRPSAPLAPPEPPAAAIAQPLAARATAPLRAAPALAIGSKRNQSTADKAAPSAARSKAATRASLPVGQAPAQPPSRPGRRIQCSTGVDDLIRGSEVSGTKSALGSPSRPAGGSGTKPNTGAATCPGRRPAGSPLNLLRQRYNSDGRLLPSDAPATPSPSSATLSTKLNDLSTLCEEDEQRAADAEQREEEERISRERARDAERQEESALEQMWDEVTEKNRDDAGKPSLWTLAWEQPPLEYGQAWGELLAAASSHLVAEPLPAVAKLGAAANREKDMIVGACRMKLSEVDAAHLRLLQTVWRRLSSCGVGAGVQPPPLRIGAHWQSVGFQGDDPTTDLRGVGLLGLMHLLALSERAPTTLRTGLTVARHRSNHFPFAVASFNFSKVAVDLLLQGNLTAPCNKEGGAVEPVLSLYLGVFKRFLARWQRNNHTVKDFGRVLRELENQASRNPQLFIQQGKQEEAP